MKILKFGGSALSADPGLHALARIVAASESRVVVVSAFEHATDELVEMGRLAGRGDGIYVEAFEKFSARHNELLKLNVNPGDAASAAQSIEELLTDLRTVLHGASLVREISAKTLDSVMAFGERLAAVIVSASLRASFPECRLLDSRQVIITDAYFGRASVDRVKTERALKSFFAKTPGLTVVTGFIAATSIGATTTLGRGGSDYTAALIASALGAAEIECWTTVDGILTADPQKVLRALPIPALSYDEALELGHFGTTLIFGPAIQPALEKKIPIRIRNILAPGFPGTVISDDASPSEHPITGISSIERIALFQVQGSGLIGAAGTARRLFDALSNGAVNVILISQASSEHSICFAVMPESAAQAEHAVRSEFELEIGTGEVELFSPDAEHSIVAVVGANMRRAHGISGRLFYTLGKNGINVSAIAQGSSELNISVVIDAKDESKALNALHDAFFLSERKSIHLFLVGLGQVGQVLLRQIAAQRERFAQKHLELRLVGAADSKRMLFNLGGIGLEHCRTLLSEAGQPMEMAGFIAKLRELNLPNSIFVDCTASQQIADGYGEILDSSVSIVTPNKRANSSSYERYTELKRKARKANVKFFYETNVGAGLPIIGTLHDLIASGDEIIRIEAVLSGTLSYLFNTFTGDSPFSSIVADAKLKGYTEPDPRDDLSGKDVARKLMILGREIGLPLEEASIRVESLVPPSCRSATSGDHFLELLKNEDGHFERLRSTAAGKGEVLRYIASIENGSASVGLQSVGALHPFYSLSGSDNIVSFTSKRYLSRPLVVKGPGAGTDVTAAGVLADILRVASYLT